MSKAQWGIGYLVGFMERYSRVEKGRAERCQR